jgi:hypothetical protein
VLRDGLDYDAAVIDTPSNLGLLTVNALVAADMVVAPVAADDEGAAQGVAELRATIAKLRRIRPALPELSVIVTKAKPRRVMSGVIEDAIASLGLQPVARVPDRTAVEQADVARTPIAILGTGQRGDARLPAAGRVPRGPVGDRMSTLRRRGLQIDDPLGPGRAVQPGESVDEPAVAKGSGPAGGERAQDIGVTDRHAGAGSARKSVRADRAPGRAATLGRGAAQALRGRAGGRAGARCGAAAVERADGGRELSAAA